MVNKMQIFEKGRRLFLKYAVKNMKIHWGEKRAINNFVTLTVLKPFLQ